MPSLTSDAGASLSPDLLLRLRSEALLAARNAYAPYSGFRVGAALLLAAPNTGEIVTGCNVENASYRLCTCAEQTAIAAAVARLGPTLRLAAVAVANLNDAASTPCGACRQTLLEFSPDPAAVTVLYPAPDASGRLVDQRCSLADLLPAAFQLTPPEALPAEPRNA